MLAQKEYVEVHVLRKRGRSISAIARHLGRDRKTVRRGGSLLPVGVTGIDGDCPAGASVEVCSPAGLVVRKGLVSSDSHAIRDRMGKRTTDTALPTEVIHRDRLVVLLALILHASRDTDLHPAT